MPTPKPGADTVLQTWERGRREHPVDRALTMLAGLSGRPRHEVAELPLDTRDRLLLERRAALFGPALAAVAGCPSCGCAVDVSVRPQAAPAGDAVFAVRVAGADLLVRLPTSLDLAAIATCADVPTARRQLARRLIDLADPGEEAIAAAETELDRRAGLSAGVIALSCPDCETQWSVELDVAAFVWREIEILAARLLRDVDALARRYGWSERDILGLSSDRRRFYLELAS
jgi:hypothetical protein